MGPTGTPLSSGRIRRAMETWKLLLLATAGLVGVGIVASVVDLDPSPGLLVGAAIFVLVSAFVTIRSYRLGQRIGTQLADDEE